MRDVITVTNRWWKCSVIEAFGDSTIFSNEMLCCAHIVFWNSIAKIVIIIIIIVGLWALHGSIVNLLLLLLNINLNLGVGVGFYCDQFIQRLLCATSFDFIHYCNGPPQIRLSVCLFEENFFDFPFRCFIIIVIVIVR